MSRIAVVGAGAWGTALAIQAERAGNNVSLWARTVPPIARLPGVQLPATISVSAGMPQSADLTLLAVPMQFMRPVLPDLPRAPVVACAKGLETTTLKLPLEVV